MKICRLCKVEKSFNDFYKQDRNKDGYKTECKSCSYNQHKKYRNSGGKEKERLSEEKRKNKDPDKWRNYLYQRTYGITLTDYNTMLENQNHCCKLCGESEKVRATNKERTPRRLAIDHDHNTGKVRGLLCHQCNVVLGQYEKYKDLFPKFQEYLDSTGG
jgi:hypothetical protein